MTSIAKIDAMTIETLSPAQALHAVKDGALLIDVRERDAYAREHIPGAVNLPLDQIGTVTNEGRSVIFHCKSGMRTTANAAKLHAAANGSPTYLLGGGIDAWRQAGQETVTNRSQPLEIMRQVQITAGVLILTSILLGLFVMPSFFGVAAFVGAGLIFAGVTGWCGMANLLRLMPWNRRLIG